VDLVEQVLAILLAMVVQVLLVEAVVALMVVEQVLAAQAVMGFSVEAEVEAQMVALVVSVVTHLYNQEQVVLEILAQQAVVLDF
jgi:hypothetical protein